MSQNILKIKKIKLSLEISASYSKSLVWTILHLPTIHSIEQQTVDIACQSGLYFVHQNVESKDWVSTGTANLFLVESYLKLAGN